MNCFRGENVESEKGAITVDCGLAQLRVTESLRRNQWKVASIDSWSYLIEY